MEFLEPNQIEKFEIDWTSTLFVRTGVPSDGSCFFHSVFYPFKSFRDLSETDKLDYIKEKRKELAKKIDETTYASIQDGSVALIQVIGAMRDFIENIEKKKIYKENNIVRLIFSLIPFETIDNEILTEWDEKCSAETDVPFDAKVFITRMKTNLYHLFYEKIVDKINELEKLHYPPPSYLTDEEKLKVYHKFSEQIYTLFDVVFESNLQNFRNEISDPSSWIDIYNFYYLVNELNISSNVLFIDSTTRKFFHIDSRFDKDRPTIILLYYPDTHFEPLGKLSEDASVRTISRLFNSEDDIIQKFMEQSL